MRGKSLSVDSRLALLSCLALVWLFQLIHSSCAKDTLNPGEVVKDWEFLESPKQFFQLGFYNPFQSSDRYLSIRCMDTYEQKMVWVANREKPLRDTSGYLNITRDGFLVISHERGASITLNPGQPATHPNATLVLLDSGNLVLKAGQQIVWQSFDHPTDVILPGMKIGLFDLKSQTQPRKRVLTSWRSPKAPATGAFTLGVNPNNTKQLEVRRRGIPYWRSPTWNVSNQIYFPFEDYSYNDHILQFSYTSNENESYFSYKFMDSSYSWIELNSTGNIRAFFQENIGKYSRGDIVVCKRVNLEGCIEQKASKCSTGDKFVGIFGSMNSWSDSEILNMSLSDCEEICRNDCSCTAYASSLPDGTGCKFSYEDRVDNPSVDNSEPIYVRDTTARKKKHQVRVVIVGVAISLGLLSLTCSLGYILWEYCVSEGKIESSQNQIGRDTQKYLTELGTSIAAMDGNGSHNLMLRGNTDRDLPLFGFSTIETATEHFSEENKLGRGGFGSVYKGKLVDGQLIAVKRLSERSSQGTEEFKNEVVLISKVQHRNLVRLYGCCIKGEEKLLVYEYLPNKSLDTFLFDETKRVLLDWKLRMKIIGGISQGLLYLHQFSRLKIIHRDLKTSNILLDNNMNPKISDFGTAKIFGENESRANTNRIVGTYGYMSPEYAMYGLFSVKSDVFSFGVMILEIISGKRNTGSYQTNESLNLTRHAWNLWKEERSCELMDPTLAETYCSIFEFERYVQIALLCIQENAEDRPNMSDVVSMLIGSDVGILPKPRESIFSAPPTNHLQSSSINGVTITTTYAR